VLGAQEYIGPPTSQPSGGDAAIGRLAARQHGSVTSTQLVALGFSPTQIAHRVRQGRLFRPHRGVFAVGRPPGTPLERAAAAVLACGPAAALSHQAALALWGFADRWPDAFDVTITSGDRRPKGITVHRSTVLTRRDIRVQLGIHATSPARTILDSTPGTPARQLTRRVNNALLTPFLTRSQLADVCARFPTHPGATLLKPFADHTDGPTRSPQEDDFPTFCERSGLPRPDMNARIAGHEVDAVFVAERLIVELDGWEFHRTRDAFEDDRNRDADTLAAGFATLRITYDRFHHQPDLEAERLREILRARAPGRGRG
jgi:Transcriptional regulator, AbiEi antitoxin/Protein of unknown function (DUF559)